MCLDWRNELLLIGARTQNATTKWSIDFTSASVSMFTVCQSKPTQIYRNLTRSNMYIVASFFFFVTSLYSWFVVVCAFFLNSSMPTKIYCQTRVVCYIFIILYVFLNAHSLAVSLSTLSLDLSILSQNIWNICRTWFYSGLVRWRFTFSSSIIIIILIFFSSFLSLLLLLIRLRCACQTETTTH